MRRARAAARTRSRSGSSAARWTARAGSCGCSRRSGSAAGTCGRRRREYGCGSPFTSAWSPVTPFDWNVYEIWLLASKERSEIASGTSCYRRERLRVVRVVEDVEAGETHPDVARRDAVAVVVVPLHRAALVHAGLRVRCSGSRATRREAPGRSWAGRRSRGSSGCRGCGTRDCRPRREGRCGIDPRVLAGGAADRRTRERAVVGPHPGRRAGEDRHIGFLGRDRDVGPGERRRDGQWLQEGAGVIRRGPPVRAGRTDKGRSPRRPPGGVCAVKLHGRGLRVSRLHSQPTLCRPRERGIGEFPRIWRAEKYGHSVRGRKGQRPAEQRGGGT